MYHLDSKLSIMLPFAKTKAPCGANQVENLVGSVVALCTLVARTVLRGTREAISYAYILGVYQSRIMSVWSWNGSVSIMRS